MIQTRFAVGTFNAYNLALPDQVLYKRLGYTAAEFDRKAEWMAGQLVRMDADVVGFQEVFHEEALRQVVARSKRYPDATVVTAGADGTFPAVGLVSRLPVLETEVIREVPPEARIDLGGVTLPWTHFSRPILRARIELPTEHVVDVYVIHLKSKRPEVPEGCDHHDPVERAKGKVRSLVIRALEAAALRTILVQRIRGRHQPVIVLGDANDAREAVTTEILSGTPPWRRMPRAVKEKIWDVLLYDVKEAHPRRDHRDVTYTHLHNGVHGSLDHIFVTQEFMRQSPHHIGFVETIQELNDHLVDETFAEDPPPRHTSDHGQVTVSLRLRLPRRPRA